MRALSIQGDASINPKNIIKTGPIEMDCDSQTVMVSSDLVHLTDKEYRVLELLLQHRGTVVTKRMFLHHLYGDNDKPHFRIIDVFINKIRKRLKGKISHDYIKTVVGRGHMWIVQTPQPVKRSAVATNTSKLPRIRRDPWYGLPCVNTVYWLAHRKHLIIEAIIDDTRPEITAESVMSMYKLAPEELWEWIDGLMTHGHEGLKVLNVCTARRPVG